MKKKILICGSTGFIGRNIAESLSRNVHFEIYGTYFKSEPLKIPNIKMIKADLTSKKEVDAAVQDKDIIIQAAATTTGSKDIVTRPYIHVTDNAVMNSLIFRSAFEHNVGHVLFFSCTVFYPTSNIPIKESDFDPSLEIFPSYFGVGWTKIYIEKMCEFYSRISNTKYTVMRHSNVYGPHDKFDLEKSHVFGATITKVMQANDGDKIIIWGSGEEERDLIYVDDLIDFVELAIVRQESRFEICNVGYGKSISINELVTKNILHSGKQLLIDHDLSKPTIKTKLCLNLEKASTIFDWQPKIALDDGIDKTIEWYRKHYHVSI